MVWAVAISSYILLNTLRDSRTDHPDQGSDARGLPLSVLGLDQRLLRELSLDRIWGSRGEESKLEGSPLRLLLYLPLGIWGLTGHQQDIQDELPVRSSAKSQTGLESLFGVARYLPLAGGHRMSAPMLTFRQASSSLSSQHRVHLARSGPSAGWDIRASSPSTWSCTGCRVTWPGGRGLARAPGRIGRVHSDMWRHFDSGLYEFMRTHLPPRHSPCSPPPCSQTTGQRHLLVCVCVAQGQWTLCPHLVAPYPRHHLGRGRAVASPAPTSASRRLTQRDGEEAARPLARRSGHVQPQLWLHGGPHF